MTNRHSDEFGYDDAELDALIDTAMTGILAKLEAAFDVKAGLADVYARAGVTKSDVEPVPAARPMRPHAPAEGRSRLQEVCDHIDMLEAYLATAVDAAQSNPFAGMAFLDAARPDLMHLRSGLANRTLPRTEAERLLDAVEHHIGQADQILRVQNATTLEDTLHTRLGGQADLGATLTAHMRVLRDMVIRLYDDADTTTSLVPAL